MPYRTPPPEKKEPEKKPLGLFGRVFHQHEWAMDDGLPANKKEYWTTWRKEGQQGLFLRYCEIKCKTCDKTIKAKGLPLSSKISRTTSKKILDIFDKKIMDHEDFLNTLPTDIGNDIDYLYEQKQETKWISAGGVVINDKFEVLLVSPSGGYGGYTWTFPKGRVDEGESKETAAIREVKEESGHTAKIVANGYLGSGEGSMSITHYWIMEPTGEVGERDFETADAKFVSFKEAAKLLSKSGRDTEILKKAYNWIRKNKK